MKRTISLKLTLTQEQSNALLETQKMFSEACNRIVPYVIENRCWNQYNLHQYSYYPLREELPSLGAQMVCCAIKKVCCSFRVLKLELHPIPLLSGGCGKQSTSRCSLTRLKTLSLSQHSYPIPLAHP